TSESVLMQGTVNGTPFNGVFPVNSIVQSFSIAHGVNLVLLNGIFRREVWQPRGGGESRFSVNVRIGAGGTGPHAQGKILNVNTAGHYRAGGFGFQAAAGLEYRIWRGVHTFGEYKYTITPQDTKIDGATASALYQSHHLVGGIGYRFVRRDKARH